MAGPWVSPSKDLEYARLARWEETDVVEMVCYDDEDQPMGNMIVVMENRVRNRLFRGYAVAIADKDYADWMLKGGHPNPGLFRLAAGNSEDKEVTYKKEKVILAVEWRLLCRGRGLLDLVAIKWVNKKKIASISDDISIRLGDRSEPVVPAKGQDRGKDEGYGDRSPPKDRGSRAQLIPGRSSRAPQDRSAVQAELDGLRASVERDPNGFMKKRGRSETPRKNPRQEKVRKDADHDGHTRKEHKEARKGSRAVGPDSPVRKVGTRAEASPSPVRKRSRSPKDKRKRKKRSDSSSGSDSAASVFHHASSSKGRSTQSKLISWAGKHPGRLMAEALQRMEDRVGRDGEAGSWDPMSMPASAKSYYLRVLRPDNPSKRNMREIHTLCTAIDHIAQGRKFQAGDVLIQRLKALELAQHTGNWERASFLELVESDAVPLVGKEEEFMAAKESEFLKRIHKSDPHHQDLWPATFPSGAGNWKGSGKAAPWGQAGKGQGKSKAKGKGKNKDNKGKYNNKDSNKHGGNNWNWQDSW